MDSHRIRNRVPTFVAGLLTGGLAIAVHAAPEAPLPLKRLSLQTDTRPIHVFVQLTEPAVAEINIAARQSKGALASRADQQQQVARIEAQQSEFRQQLASLGVTELGTQRIAANGFRLRIRPDQMEALRRLPNVRSVGRLSVMYPANVTSVPWIGAPQVWNELNIKGEGTTVGVIDTGIDYTHANFGGSGNPADYARLDRNVITPGTFPTAKVTCGFDVAGSQYDVINDPNPIAHPDPNPLDGSGHGSHVAGTIAGFGIPGQIGRGVAPAAKLCAIKMFDDVGHGSDLMSPAIEWAMDPNGDGDVSDHLDVLNISATGQYFDPDDPDSMTAQRAVDLGMVVVASAGNAGNVPYVTTAPASAPGAISVAASIPGGHEWSKVTVTAPATLAGLKLNLEGGGPTQLRNTGPISGTLVPSDPALGCSAFSNAGDVAGHIALVRRGVCSFNEKYLAAQAAGARAIIVYNDGATADRVEPAGMTVDDPTVAIPGVMIGSVDGFAIAAAANAAQPVNVTMDVGPDSTRDDQLISISSRGPGAIGSALKPDMSAPGFNITSSAAGTGTGATTEFGTSMSAPHVAGAAALLRQKHPNFAPAAIKALLQNSTVGANDSGDTALVRQGVGVLRVDRAAKLTSYASPAGVSFGRLNPAAPLSRSQRISVTEFSGNARTFTARNVPHTTYPGVTVSCPSSVTVGANRSSDVDIDLSFDPRVALSQGVADDWSQSQREIDGWCELSDGKDTLRVGYLAVVDAASQVVSQRTPSGQVTFSNLGPSIGLAEGFTLIGGRKGPPLADAMQESTAPAPINTLRALGVRHTTVSNTDTFQFAVVLDRVFRSVVELSFSMMLDIDGDQVDDVKLAAADLWRTGLPFGSCGTSQFDLKTGNGFTDWPCTWDFNDRVAILTYTTAANAGATGLVPAKFHYRLNLIRSQDDSIIDTLEGTVDMSSEVAADLNDFTLHPGEAADVGFSRAGTMLWVYRGNTPSRQADVVTVNVAGK